MRRWQRRTHFWLWLIITICVTAVLVALIEDQPRLAQSPPAQAR